MLTQVGRTDEQLRCILPVANQQIYFAMLQQTTSQSNQIIQYVVGKADLEDIITNLVNDKMERFYANKKAEANADKLLTPKEVTEILGVNLTTLWRWHNEGYLVKVYIGDKPRYKQSDIDRILMRGGEK